MSTAVYIAQGTTLSVDKLNTGVTYVPVAQIDSFDGPSNTVGAIETTNLSSTRKTYRPGLPDGGDISFDLQFDPSDTDHLYLRGLADTPILQGWRVSYPTLPTAKWDTFQGFLTEFHPKGDGPEGILTASVKIKITGAIVTTDAA
jgi:hypothetical protein